MKKNKRSNFILSLSLIILIVTAICAINFNNYSKVVHAEESLEVVDLEAECANMTNSVVFYVNGDEHEIRDYEQYVHDRFDIENHFNHNRVTDEWIFKIIPEILFKEKVEDFFYIGAKYGFYVNYEGNNQFLVYLMEHSINIEEKNGHIVRRITPVYYEKYIYKENTGIELRYYTQEEFSFYRPCYYDFKYLLKNISFNGELYNYNDYNYGENNYDASQDNGGYFIGASYKFKGVSKQSGQGKFIADVFAIAFDAAGGTVAGAISTVASSVSAVIDFSKNTTADFRGEISNEKYYGIEMEQISRGSQIEEHGHLLKHSVSAINTENDNPLLFDKGCKNYVESTMYYNFANQDIMSNTGFVGRVSIDIVEELGDIVSFVHPHKTNIESNEYKVDIYNDKSIDITENELTDVYSLAGRTSKLSFTAPENGIYTFETFGSIDNYFDVPFGVVTDKSDRLNQKLTVKLEKGKTYIFDSQNLSDDNGIYQIEVEFTPAEIKLDETNTLIVKAGESEFFTFNNEDGIGFNYSLNKTGDFSVNIALENRFNVIDTAVMNNKNSSALIPNEQGKYYIKITNNSAVDEEVEFAITRAIQTDVGECTFSVGHRALYRITPLEVSCIMEFQSLTLNDVKISLLDDNFNIIVDKDDMVSGLKILFEEGKTYYLLFEIAPNIINKQNCQYYILPTRLHLGAILLPKV